MYERFTDHARKAMQLANQAAQRMNHEYIGTEHVLLGLMDQGEGVGLRALTNLGVNVAELRAEVEAIVQAGAQPIGAKVKLPQTPRAKKVIEYAMEESRQFKHDYVGTEHLLLGLLREREGIAAQVLSKRGLTLEAVRAEVIKLVGGAPPPARTKPKGIVTKRASLMGRHSMYEQFTDRARKVMQSANQEAQQFNHEYIGTEHVLLGLIKEGSGVAANVLKNLDVDLRKIRLEVKKLVQRGHEMVTMGKLPQTPRAKKVIEYSLEEARNLNHNYVGTEHILLGLLREHDAIAGQVLLNLGLNLDRVREETVRLLDTGIRGTSIASRPLLQSPEEIEDLPAELQATIAELDAEVHRLVVAKKEAVSIQDFQKAASLRDEADTLRRRRRATLGEWLAKRSIDASVLAWSDGAVVKLAQAINEKQWWSLLPRLAEWLETADCTDAEVLAHCRQPGEHTSHCWVIDLLLSRVMS
jgi:hypothetical protein